jgi:predicted GNAT family acetyltransferase
MDGTDPRPIEVRHAASPTRGAFVIERDGHRLAEMTYVRAGAKRLIVDHTFVDDALRREGAGRRLLQAVVDWARAEHLLVIPVCPFAKAMFERDASIQDVLA